MNELLLIIGIVFIVMLCLLATIWSLLEDIKFEKQLNKLMSTPENSFFEDYEL